MNIIRNLARLLISPVFIFAGFVKLIDPLGLTYKFSDYFVAFHLDFLNPIALVLAIALSATELLIGTNLLLRIRMKETSWALMIFMVFFTILTFIIAITNPVSDCGCFGDALILTNWQTFFKNLIFLIPTLIVFYERDKYNQIFSPLVQWSVTVLIFLINILLSVYYLRNLPPLDFRPYKIGTHILSSMEIPEGMPMDEYETVLVYEKEGIAKEFTLDSPEQPWNDSTWEWIETKNVLVKEGYKPPIHDFSLTTLEGVDITDQMLYDPGYSFLVIAYDLEKSSHRELTKIKSFSEKASEIGFSLYGMTSSTDDIIHEIIDPFNYNFDFYTSDEITLKTIIRSNPGLVLIKNGVIIGKWPGRSLPDLEKLEKSGISASLSALQKANSDGIALIVVLIYTILGILTTSFRLYRLNE